MMKNDFVFVDEFISGIRWDAKYATWDNFTGKPVDGYVANRIVGTSLWINAQIDSAGQYDYIQYEGEMI